VSGDASSHWEMPCTDATGRPRQLTVTVTRVGHVSVITPPGESGTMPPDRVGMLIDLLTQARQRALRGEVGSHV
jgi:hypothetical protein